MWYPEGNGRSLSVIFNHCTVEALRMHWLKRDRWKVHIDVAGMLLLLVLMVWVPGSVAAAQERVSGLVTPVTITVQATPTEDATVTALNKEKLAQEVQQLKNQNEQLKNQNGPDLFAWLRMNASIFLSTLVVVIGGLIGLGRWLADRRSEREKRAEERFQKVVEGLAGDNEGAKVAAAILLRTFLRPGYEQFYTQTFDLAVSNLRLRHLDPDTPEPLTSLSQALIIVFKESFWLARERLKQSPQFLDSSCIQLDNAHLAEADLQWAGLPDASIRNAALRRADFSEANLYKVNLFQADLKDAILTKAILYKANLVSTDLSRTHLSQADLRGANLKEANIEDVLSLKDTNLRGATGLTKDQLVTCKAKGAIIDEDITASPPQSPVSPPAPSQSNDAQASSTPPAQVSTPVPETDGRSKKGSIGGNGP